MKLNAEYIKVALKCHSDPKNKCEICPYNKKCCSMALSNDALALINSQEQKILELENRLKECENGYEGTLFLDRCKLHDAEEKVKELTQSNEQLSESFDHLEKTKDELLSERSRLIEKCQEAEKINKEKCNLEYTLLGVMHSVDKWLDGDELEQDEVNRAITMREKTLQIVEKLTEENERLRAVIDKKEETMQIIAKEKQSYYDELQTIKTDTVREMLQRIKEDALSVSLLSNPPKFMLEIREDALDQIAKEMSEGENAEQHT